MPFKINIALKCAPFSHTSWFRTVIPRTTCLAEIFPTALHLQERKGSTYKSLFKLTGPIDGFTVQVDAQKGTLRVFGKAQEGAFSYLLFEEEGALYLFLEKGPFPYPLKMKQHLMDLSTQTDKPSLETLSLGMHRKQEWDLILRRKDMREIFPIWLKLGSQLPTERGKVPTKEGNYALLEECRTVIENREKVKVCAAFHNLFVASFSGILVPHLNDPRFLGLSIPTKQTLSPLPLFRESSALIRTLFFQEESSTWSLLPVLPPQFHAGRFLHLQTKAGDLIDMEWTKKLLRRVIIRPAQTRTIHFNLQKALKNYRLRSHRKDRGTTHSTSAPLPLEKGTTLYLDRFQK